MAKQSEIVPYQPKTFKNLKCFDIKSVITEHANPSSKLSNTIRQAEQVDSNGSLFNGKKT